VIADHIGLQKPQEGTPEPWVNDFVRGTADGVGYLLPGTGLAKAAEQ